MNNELYNKAKQLADRPYCTVAFCDLSGKGEAAYIARNPEFQGCMAQGDTCETARMNLANARIDFIHFLLERDLDIPEPQSLNDLDVIDFR